MSRGGIEGRCPQAVVGKQLLNLVEVDDGFFRPRCDRTRHSPVGAREARRRIGTGARLEPTVRRTWASSDLTVRSFSQRNEPEAQRAHHDSVVPTPHDDLASRRPVAMTMRWPGWTRSVRGVGNSGENGIDKTLPPDHASHAPSVTRSTTPQRRLGDIPSSERNVDMNYIVAPRCRHPPTYPAGSGRCCSRALRVLSGHHD